MRTNTWIALIRIGLWVVVSIHFLFRTIELANTMDNPNPTYLGRFYEYPGLALILLGAICLGSIAMVFYQVKKYQNV